MALWPWLYHGKNTTKIAMEKTPAPHPRLLPRIRSGLVRTHCRGLGAGKGRLDLKFNHPRKEKYQQFYIMFTIKKMDWTNPFFLIWTSRWSIEASNMGYKNLFSGRISNNRCRNEGLISPQSMAIELFKGSFGPSLGIRILAILGSYRPKNWILKDVTSIIGGLCTANDPKFWDKPGRNIEDGEYVEETQGINMNKLKYQKIIQVTVGLYMLKFEPPPKEWESTSPHW